MKIRYYSALVLIVLLMLVVTMIPAVELEQQVIAEQTWWEWFNNQTTDTQWKTLFLATSPGWVAVGFVILVMTSFNHTHPVRDGKYLTEDQKKLYISSAMAAFIGFFCVLFMRGMINDIFNYPLYGDLSLLAGVIMTPIANIAFFKLLTWFLLLVFEIGDAIPENIKIAGIPVGWVGIPLKNSSKIIYRGLTANHIAVKREEKIKKREKSKRDKEEDDTEDDGYEATEILDPIADRMKTRIAFDPDTTIPRAENKDDKQ